MIYLQLESLFNNYQQLHKEYESIYFLGRLMKIDVVTDCQQYV